MSYYSLFPSNQFLPPSIPQISQRNQTQYAIPEQSERTQAISDASLIKDSSQKKKMAQGSFVLQRQQELQNLHYQNHTSRSFNPNINTVNNANNANSTARKSSFENPSNKVNGISNEKSEKQGIIQKNTQEIDSRSKPLNNIKKISNNEIQGSRINQIQKSNSQLNESQMISSFSSKENTFVSGTAPKKLSQPITFQSNGIVDKTEDLSIGVVYPSLVLPSAIRNGAPLFNNSTFVRDDSSNKIQKTLSSRIQNVAHNDSPNLSYPGAKIQNTSNSLNHIPFGSSLSKASISNNVSSHPKDLNSQLNNPSVRDSAIRGNFYSNSTPLPNSLSTLSNGLSSFTNNVSNLTNSSLSNGITAPANSGSSLSYLSPLANGVSTQFPTNSNSIEQDNFGFSSHMEHQIQNPLSHQILPSHSLHTIPNIQLSQNAQMHATSNQSLSFQNSSEPNTLNLIEKLELWNLTPKNKRESANSLSSIGSSRSSLSVEESWGSTLTGTNSDLSGNRLSSSSVASFLSESPFNSRGNRLSNSSLDSNHYDAFYPTQHHNNLTNHPLYHLNQIHNDDTLQEKNIDKNFSPLDMSSYHLSSDSIDFDNIYSNIQLSGLQSDILPEDFDNFQEADFSTLEISESGTRIYDNTNVFVKHLPPTMNDEELRNCFSQFGEIVSCKVMLNVKNKTSLGFGFIRFKDSISANLAIEKMTGFRMGKKKLLCKLSNKELPVVGTEPRTNLYVKHLPTNFDNEKLKKLFEKYGNIKEVKVMMDKNTGQSKQIGFVRFDKQVSATRALFEMNNVILKEEDCATPLNVHYAETSTEKRMRQVHQQARLSISQQFIANQQRKSIESISTEDIEPEIEIKPEVEIEINLESDIENNIKKEMNLKKDETQVANQNANLFIFHLPPDVRDKELNELFTPFGDVDSVRVITDKNGVSKGFGFVKYFKFDDALRAITAMNGFKLGKKHIKVSFKQ